MAIQPLRGLALVTLMTCGSTVAHGAPSAMSVEVPAPRMSPTDWVLRVFGGYSRTDPAAFIFNHGGHVGLAAHASRPFGARGRGYIGGGPRLHYRGIRRLEPAYLTLHQFGTEGDLLLGGGSDKFVGLFSLRLGLGLTSDRIRSHDGLYRSSSTGFGGWLLGGIGVRGKIAGRWSVGGHAEAGITGMHAAPLIEVGLDLGWHFGQSREGI